MALNFTVSYTFSPNTTISSSQVNTNTSDVANVFTGLEAETKSFAKLKVDIDPTAALNVATKQYVDHYAAWRRPNLQFGSVTTVAVESGLDGTSGNIPILFSDGSVRTETSTTRTTFDITRNAVLTTSGAQSGLTGATSEANNTWYALYACKVTDSSTQWVTVGSTVLPLQANYATLNTAYGTSGWVYLGMIRNGDNASSIGDILTFVQSGAHTRFRNASVGDSATSFGHILAKTSGAAGSLTWAYSAGTGAAQVPNHVLVGFCSVSIDTASTALQILDSAAANRLAICQNTTSSGSLVHFTMSLTTGIRAQPSTSTNKMDIMLMGYVDSVLAGVGSNPLL